MSNPDVIVVGCGFSGATAARELAEKGGKKVVILEERDHIGGNAYDCFNEDGFLIHLYGPHIFHTSNKRVFDYLSRFCEWNGYQHCVKALINNLYVPVPFNLNTIHQLFDEEKAARLEKKLVDTYGMEKKATILELRQNSDPEIHELAEYVYQNVFLYYTMKQWGKKPEEIDPNTTARVPVFVSRDDRYFQDTYQGLPTKGYTALIQEIVNHPSITIRLSTDARKLLDVSQPQVLFEGRPFNGIIIYTGAADELFDCKFGRLSYRTLDFVFETHQVDEYQPAAVVNFTTTENYTRITEIKKMTGQKIDGKTNITKEYSKPYEGGEQIPYYSIINPETLALYAKYKELGDKIPNFYFLGRLAEFKYYNMDVTVARALELVDRILSQ